jgi:hypothetical protein
MALGGSPDIGGQRAVHPCGDGLGIETILGVRRILFTQRVPQETMHRLLGCRGSFVFHQILII